MGPADYGAGRLWGQASSEHWLARPEEWALGWVAPKFGPQLGNTLADYGANHLASIGWVAPKVVSTVPSFPAMIIDDYGANHSANEYWANWGTRWPIMGPTI